MKEKNKKKNTLIIILIILLLALAVGYAAFSDILSISGTANAKGTFDLEFQNAEVVKMIGVNEEKTKAVISEDKNTLTVTAADLAYPGAGVEYSVNIVNVGTIPAKVLNVTAKGLTGTDHIVIKGLDVIEADHPTINAGDKCNIHFTVEWPADRATEIAENEEATFELKVEYVQSTGANFDGETSHTDGTESTNTTPGGEVDPTPEQPGVQTLVSQITGADYGKSINYKATVNGQEVSNWKIFHNDGINVYIILDDYLPTSLLPTSAGLYKNYTYSIWSNKNRDTLLTGLTTQSNWSEFANGVEGALATGSPTNAQFVASWNTNPAVNSRQLEVGNGYYEDTNGGVISDPTNLYIPHTEKIDNDHCSGYRLATPHAEYSSYAWIVKYDGSLAYGTYNDDIFGIRPVVCLPSDVTGTVGGTVEL